MDHRGMRISVNPPLMPSRERERIHKRFAKVRLYTICQSSRNPPSLETMLSASLGTARDILGQYIHDGWQIP